jgi:hypothetical protein
VFASITSDPTFATVSKNIEAAGIVQSPFRILVYAQRVEVSSGFKRVQQCNDHRSKVAIWGNQQFNRAKLLNFFGSVRVLFCAERRNFQLTWVASGNDTSHPPEWSRECSRGQK